jgi:hypothetical protein
MGPQDPEKLHDELEYWGSEISVCLPAGAGAIGASPCRQPLRRACSRSHDSVCEQTESTRVAITWTALHFWNCSPRLIAT